MVCLMEVFWAGWSCLGLGGAVWRSSGLGGGVWGWMGVLGAGRSRFGLVHIGDFDITRRYATRREMSRNVKKCLSDRSRYWGGPNIRNWLYTVKSQISYFHFFQSHIGIIVIHKTEEIFKNIIAKISPGCFTK